MADIITVTSGTAGNAGSTAAELITWTMRVIQI